MPSQMQTLDELDKELSGIQDVLLECLEEKETLLRSNELASFVPNPGGQATFFEQSNKYLRAVFSGNRFGKSTAGVVEDCCWLLGYRPFFPVGHPLRTLGIPKHGVKGLVIAATWDKVRDIFVREGDPAVDDRIGKFFTYLPAHTITARTRNQNSIVSSLEITSETEGKVRKSLLVFDTVSSFLTKPIGKESSDWDFIHLDEPCPEPLWEAISRGLIDRNGKSWWLMTPITEPWMYYRATEQVIKNPDKYWVYEGDTDENLTLGEEEKENFFGTLTEEAKAARKSGRPLALSRLVISNFNSKPVAEGGRVIEGTPLGWKNPFTPPDQHMIAVAVDTHPQTPHATLKVSVSPLGEVFIYNERFVKGAINGEKKGDDSICGWLKEAPEFSQMRYLLLEPGAWNEDQTTGRRFVDSFFEAKLDPLKGSKKRAENNILFNDLFGRTDRKIYVLAHCRVFLKEIRQWYFNKDDKATDKNDHMMENFGRLLAHDNFQYYPPYDPNEIFDVPVMDSLDFGPAQDNTVDYNAI